MERAQVRRTGLADVEAELVPEQLEHGAVRADPVAAVPLHDGLEPRPACEGELRLSEGRVVAGPGQQPVEVDALREGRASRRASGDYGEGGQRGNRA